MFMNRKNCAVWAATAMTLPALAFIRPAYVFTDQMVLQAHQPVPVWGMADPDERITVTYGEVKAETVANAEGRWRVNLPEMDYVKNGRTLKLRGSNAVEFKDVLVGEVWLGLGQSNMEFPLDNCEEGKAIAKGGVLPEIVRYFHLPKNGAVKPCDMFAIPREVRWRKYDTANEADSRRMSMLMTLFAKRLLQDLDVPIGLVSIAAGGANLETWMSAEAIAEAGTAKEAERLLKTCEGWRQNDIKRWLSRSEKEKDRFFPRINYESRPTQCWNAQICPLAPYRFRGLLWYQGEMNSGWQLYQKQFPFFAKHLRAAFENPELPLFIVQLPDYKGDHWPFIRNVQRLMSEQVPRTGLVVTIDGHEIDLHPRDKRKVADRLARLALTDCFGRSLVSRSPAPTDARLAAAKAAIVVFYKDVAGGLKLSDGDTPRTFEVAGADRKFVPATAKLSGADRILVKVPDGVKEVKYLRYGWDPDPDVNVINSAGLPATPYEVEVN